MVFYGTEVDYCPKCLGLWFERDELRQAKDKKAKDLNWLDIDLWEDKTKFRVAQSEKNCPFCCPDCLAPLYTVEYGDSGIKVEVCVLCRGVWLDRGEFKKIIAYLKDKGKDEVFNRYLKNLAEEAFEIANGPETFKEEVGDFLSLLQILNYKFIAKHPIISQIILDLPK